MQGLSPMVSGSPDTVTASDSAHVQITRLHVPVTLWDRMVVLLLAISVMVNIACWSIIKEESMQHELKRYNMDTYRGEFEAKLADVRIENTRMFLEKCQRTGG